MTAGVNSQKKKNHETANYHRTQMQKEIVIQRLREQGCRITCLLYTSPSPRDPKTSRMPSSA